MNGDRIFFIVVKVTSDMTPDSVSSSSFDYNKYLQYRHAIEGLATASTSDKKTRCGFEHSHGVGRERPEECKREVRNRDCTHDFAATTRTQKLLRFFFLRR